MSKDTLTLVLNGDVPLGLFAEAMRYFDVLIQSLTEEVAGPYNVEWTIHRLSEGSARATIRGHSEEVESIEKVVRAYEIIGVSLADRRPIPYSETVAVSARAITSLLNGHVRSVDFSTDDHTVSIRQPVRADEVISPVRRRQSLGVITGTVRAIWDQPIKLGLYDSLFEKTVYCFLRSDQERLARDVWRKHVAVTGLITRDPETGRPLEIHDVKQVKVLAEAAPSASYRQARGSLPGDDEPAEVTIRRMRDAI